MDVLFCEPTANRGANAVPAAGAGHKGDLALQIGKMHRSSSIPAWGVARFGGAPGPAAEEFARILAPRRGGELRPATHRKISPCAMGILVVFCFVMQIYFLLHRLACSAALSIAAEVAVSLSCVL
jgi:hypothetical protein